MKKGFTLIELLVVVGIMGLLGTASVGGYHQMRRGMADKGVIQDVNTLIRAAYQRAQIDRQPTAVVFWNETLRGENDDADESAIIVGKAVAVRRSGRITKVTGNKLLDEFGDLELSYPTGDESGSSSTDIDMYLYPMDDLSEVEQATTIRRSLVETKVYSFGETPVYLTGEKNEQFVPGSATKAGEGNGRIYVYGFMLKDQNGVNWKAGKAYGFEFAHVTLPHGYVFGSGDGVYSKSSNDPVRPVGTLVFDVGYNNGNGMSTGSSGGLGTRSSIPISTLKLDRSGNFKVEKIGDSAKPTDKMK